MAREPRPVNTDAARLWVPGWLTQLVLLALAIAALVIGNADMAAIYLTGSAVIGAMRQIELDRRR